MEKLELATFSDLLGKTCTDVTATSDEVIFTVKRGYSKLPPRKFKLYHEQKCCEAVYIESIVGDLHDLIGKPLLIAEVISNARDKPLKKDHLSFTWTFYKLATINGSVTIRFYGESSGYYSEEVNFAEILPASRDWQDYQKSRS